MIRVVIPEGIPSLNKGEAAILEGLHVMLSLVGEHEVMLYSPDAWRADDARNYAGLAKVVGGINLHAQGVSSSQGNGISHKLCARLPWYKLFVCAAVSRVSGRLAKCLFRDELLSAMIDADVVLAAHDGMMGPGQSNVVRAGRIMNRPVALVGGGCGSTVYTDLSVASRKKLRYAASKAACCVVRDAHTYDLLLSCGVNESDVRLAPDPAVLLPPCEENRVTGILDAEDIPASARDRMCAVISAQGGIVARESFGKNEKPDVRRGRRVGMWKELLAHLLSTTDAYVVFLPHSVGPTPQNDDRKMARDIYESLAGDKSRVKCIETEYSAGELKGIMKICQLVLSERAHAAIGSFSSGTPCIGFTVKRDIRMHGIINEMFKRPICELDDPDVSQLKALVTTEWTNRHNTSAEMADRVARTLEEARAAAGWVRGRLDEKLNR